MVGSPPPPTWALFSKGPVALLATATWNPNTLVAFPPAIAVLLVQVTTLLAAVQVQFAAFVPTSVTAPSVMLNPVGPLAQTLSWLPFSSPIVMPMRMTMMAIPWWQVVGSIVVGLVGCAGTIWLAARIYRVGMLMYGKKPSFAELARWIRYAR